MDLFLFPFFSFGLPSFQSESPSYGGAVFALASAPYGVACSRFAAACDDGRVRLFELQGRPSKAASGKEGGKNATHFFFHDEEDEDGLEAPESDDDVGEGGGIVLLASLPKTSGQQYSADASESLARSLRRANLRYPSGAFVLLGELCFFFMCSFSPISSGFFSPVLPRPQQLDEGLVLSQSVLSSRPDPSEGRGARAESSWRHLPCSSRALLRLRAFAAVVLATFSSTSLPRHASVACSGVYPGGREAGRECLPRSQCVAGKRTLPPLPCVGSVFSLRAARLLSVCWYAPGLIFAGNAASTILRFSSSSSSATWKVADPGSGAAGGGFVADGKMVLLEAPRDQRHRPKDAGASGKEQRGPFVSALV